MHLLVVFFCLQLHVCRLEVVEVVLRLRNLESYFMERRPGKFRWITRQ